MKKYFLLIAAISISLGAMAQKGKVTSAQSYIDQGALDKAKDALDQAMTNEKSKDWFNTYFVMGKLCQAIYETDNPKFNSYYNDPLQEAYASYQKAMELDPKGTARKRIITGMVYNKLAVDFFNQGSKRFEEKDYTGSLKSFASEIGITESDNYVGAIDTGMYYNAGLAAINCDKYSDAVNYFQKCIDMKYMGVTPYFQLSECYLNLGDTAKSEALLLDLPNKFPNNKNITLSLVDLYLKSNKIDEAMKYLKIAKQDDPDNYNLYLVTGIAYLNQDKFDEAIPELQKAVELQPDRYDTEYTMGAAYINKASDMFSKANEIIDVNKYSAAIEEANNVYKKALPFVEKAYELKPDDVNAMQSLQELYYRFKQKDPSLAPKYDAIKAKLDSLKSQQ